MPPIVLLTHEADGVSYSLVVTATTRDVFGPNGPERISLPIEVIAQPAAEPND